ncbi:Amt family ammonium transporter [Neomicrococcus aestuarii]|uniref:Ammonium transporter n=1 Tax=Neomicrococcus aestuarii TaxID=556325 RepID=A0A7W8TSI7_9MICC|nr:ammonium transporter [Neomicrococcus aestuarii]MBB5511973.1 Amt family ammonium transporter [Neomicrococcus aestuarii]
MPESDLAWLLAAFALVTIMFPGLAFYYGGLLGKNNVLNMIMMVLSSLAIAAILYVLYGHGMVSGSSIAGLGLVGNPLEFIGLNGLEVDDTSGGAQSIYWVAFFILFAAITIAIVASGAAGRMKFGAWIVFSAIWLTLVYFPIAHWVFTFSNEETGYVGGWLRNVVELHDFAGGTAVHMTAGVGALALALVLGKSRTPQAKPHNLPMVILGAGLLWVGWFGFNGGSAAGSNFLAQYVIMTTLLAGCAGTVGYLIVEKIRDGQPTTLGLATGTIAGLVGITPSADAVNPLGALVVGLASGAVVCWAITWKQKLGFDDTLDAFAVHGIGGIVGTLCVVLIGSATAPAGVTGVLFGGDWSILWRELTAIAATCLYAFVVTYLIAWVMNKISRIRVDEETEYRGLDLSLHSESAYTDSE